MKKHTVKSQCPQCNAVLESVDIIYGVKAMMACPCCATLLEVEVEEVDDQGNIHPITTEQGEK